MGITIKDIARDTGLSLATISKYLNNKSISAENQNLISESIKRLNYIPNKAAQALRSKTSHCICICMPGTWDYHFGYECNYIVEYMKQHSYSTLVRSYSPTAKDFSKDILFLENRQIDGVVLFTHTDYPQELLSLLSANNIPYICLHQKPESKADFVGCNDREAGAMAADFLHRMGYFHVTLAGCSSYSTKLRIQGFVDKFERHGIKEQVNIHILSSSHTVLQSLDFSQKNNDREPNALVSLEHGTTIQLLECLSHKLLKTLPLLAFDDDDLFTAVTPSITVFAQNTKALGVKAAELLLKRIQRNTEDFPEALLVPPILLERESIPRRAE